MPRFASAKNPARACVAPVNAPRVWPNSSASASSAGIALQLKRTSGPLGAPALRVEERADELLARPGLAAHEDGDLLRRDARRRVEELAHRRRLAHDAAADGVLRGELAVPLSRSARASSARSSARSISSTSNGFVTYSYAPALMARTASRSEPCAVSRITGRLSSRSRTARSSSIPSISGIEKSVTTASARSTSSSASAPERATSGSQPRPWTSSFSAARTDGSSSTSSTRGIAVPLEICSIRATAPASSGPSATTLSLLHA